LVRTSAGALFVHNAIATLAASDDSLRQNVRIFTTICTFINAFSWVLELRQLINFLLLIVVVVAITVIKMRQCIADALNALGAKLVVGRVLSSAVTLVT